MTMTPPNFESDQRELADLRSALRMMGLDPERLAAFVSDDRDRASKTMLLTSLSITVDERKLQGSDVPAWNRWLDLLRNKNAEAAEQE